MPYYHLIVQTRRGGRRRELDLSKDELDEYMKSYHNNKEFLCEGTFVKPSEIEIRVFKTPKLSKHYKRDLFPESDLPDIEGKGIDITRRVVKGRPRIRVAKKQEMPSAELEEPKWSDTEYSVFHLVWWMTAWFITFSSIDPFDFLNFFHLPGNDSTTLLFFSLIGLMAIFGPIMEILHRRFLGYDMKSLTGMVLIAFVSSVITYLFSPRFILAYLLTPIAPLFLEGLRPLLNSKTMYRLKSEWKLSLFSVGLVDISLISIVWIGLEVFGR